MNFFFFYATIHKRGKKEQSSRREKMQRDGPHIFLSYSRSNSAFALKLAKDLRSAKFSIWIDQLDIPSGASWDREVEAALRASETVLVIISEASAKSDNVLDEISYSLDQKKRVIPVLIDQIPVPLRITRLQREDFTGSYETAFDTLTEHLRPQKSRTEALEAIKTKPWRQRRGFKAAAFVLVIIAIAVSIAVFRETSDSPPTVVKPTKPLLQEVPESKKSLSSGAMSAARKQPLTSSSKERKSLTGQEAYAVMIRACRSTCTKQNDKCRAHCPSVGSTRESADTNFKCIQRCQETNQKCWDKCQ